MKKKLTLTAIIFIIAAILFGGCGKEEKTYVSNVPDGYYVKYETVYVESGDSAWAIAGRVRDAVPAMKGLSIPSIIEGMEKANGCSLAYLQYGTYIIVPIYIEATEASK